MTDKNRVISMMILKNELAPALPYLPVKNSREAFHTLIQVIAIHHPLPNPLLKRNKVHKVKPDRKRAAKPGSPCPITKEHNMLNGLNLKTANRTYRL